ncbi:hypothetical protein ACFX5U_20405 [Sphingobacterium sp. SG20118]|uniref:hypothetical protein n=1 Tax=Sphingobacterium sp. SG20118 TaxID=3367156 RepID=UPI0037DFC5DA
MKNFIQKYALAIVAVVTIITFSAYKVSGVDSKAAFATTPIYFHGDPTNPADVENEALWTTTPNGQSCNGSNAACMMLVENTDLTGSQLNPIKITLQAVLGASGLSYIPQRFSGTGTPSPTIVNKN